MKIEAHKIGTEIFWEGNPYPIETKTERFCPKCGKEMYHDCFCEAFGVESGKIVEEGLFQCRCGFEKVMRLK